MNLIFAVPHDGKEKPKHLPTRKQGCKNSKGVCQFPGRKSCSKNNICKVATMADAHTQDIARTVFHKFVKTTGKTPHLIINNLHRSKMDPNRDSLMLHREIWMPQMHIMHIMIQSNMQR